MIKTALPAGALLGGALPAKAFGELTKTLLVTMHCPTTGHRTNTQKVLLAMKLTVILLTIGFLNVSANGLSQKVSFSGEGLPLTAVLSSVKQQTGFVFVYSKAVLEKARPVSIEAVDVPLHEFLTQLFKNQQLTFSYKGRNILISPEPSVAEILSTESRDQYLPIRGRVQDEDGKPLTGASVALRNSRNVKITDADGFFEMDVKEGDVIVVSFIGYQNKEIKLSGAQVSAATLNITLSRFSTELDETIVTAYGKTSRRLNTGNISKVSGEELQQQPVGNPLLGLTGRVPGLIITQTSGLNGAAVTVQLRGQNSILQGSEPLYIIDGIPFGPGNSRLNQVSNATSEAGMSPFNLISMDNIESIEILKDADATAIYGSRGANGVILITTKKGKAGKTSFNVNVNTGISKTSRTMDMLDTRQYVAMRREAFLNDGLIPSADPFDPGYAPDIMVWDSTRYTDLKRLLIGGTAKATNAQASVSGGSSTTQFVIGGAYQRQTTVFPTDHGETKVSANFNITHNSSNKRFNIRLSGSYLANENRLNISDLTSFIDLPPNIKLFGDDGRVNWEEAGVPFANVLYRQNPLGYLEASYTGKFKNLMTNAEIGYHILDGLVAKLSLGYNTQQANETSAEPSSSIDPNSGNLPSAFFANRTNGSWIAEPQLEYNKNFNWGKITALLGSTWQETGSDGLFVQAFNYTNDALLGSTSGAGTVRTNNTITQYRYTAFFGRVTYNFRDRYILNASGRRDGSSRFGPTYRFSNFGAIGAAWIFTEEKALHSLGNFLSFGKLRASWGVTGNDQIGDYRYLDTWTASPTTYQNIPVANPSALYNPDFSWEGNRKMELALELGFLQNKIVASAAWYRNRCNNQLINYTLPIQTGFNTVLTNLDAALQNEGFEFQLTTRNIDSRHIKWTSTFNISANRNKLLAFPGLANSSYANAYVVGRSITTRQLYYYTGVDAQTGVYQFRDVDRDGILDRNDRTNLRNIDPRFFGGLSNSLQYKGLSLTLFFEFRKQSGFDFLSNNSTITVPGYDLVNQPIAVLDRWRKPGDITTIQRFTASPSSEAFGNMLSYLPLSDANISDASFVRCKNIALAYEIPAAFARSLKLERCQLYVNAQNLFVITNYRGADPETQNMFVLPPLKTLVAGININF